MTEKTRKWVERWPVWVQIPCAVLVAPFLMVGLMVFSLVLLTVMIALSFWGSVFWSKEERRKHPMLFD